jgi:hypothetical protein
MNPTLQIILSVILGGSLWEGFKFLYPDLKIFITSRNLAKKTFYSNIDSLLKAANELYGKLESLGKEDFSSLY